MANSSTPFGFLSYGHRDGSAPTMGLEQVAINSSDANLYFTGDSVIWSSAGGKAISPFLTSTAASVMAGVFAGCEYYTAAAQRVVWSRYYPGSVGSNAANGITKAWIISDPEMQFVAASAGTFSSADIGMNVDPLSSQSSLGNTATGQSAMILSTATVANNSSLAFMIVDLLANQSVSGTPNTESGTYNRVIVAPNMWRRHAGTTGLST